MSSFFDDSKINAKQSTFKPSPTTARKHMNEADVSRRDDVKSRGTTTNARFGICLRRREASFNSSITANSENVQTSPLLQRTKHSLDSNSCHPIEDNQLFSSAHPSQLCLDVISNHDSNCQQSVTSKPPVVNNELESNADLNSNRKLKLKENQSNIITKDVTNDFDPTLQLVSELSETFSKKVATDSKSKLNQFTHFSVSYTDEAQIT